MEGREDSVIKEKAMRMVLSAIAVSAAAIATDASAQGVNLTGPYRCVAGCVSARPGLAFVTQNGLGLNLVNEVGEPSRGWVDDPGRLWVARANLGAIYSPDGMTIQFDNGTIWQRAPEAPPPRLVGAGKHRPRRSLTKPEFRVILNRRRVRALKKSGPSV